MLNFVSLISLTWVVLTNVCFSQSRTFNSLENAEIERLLSAKSGHALAVNNSSAYLLLEDVNSARLQGVVV
jgi:hypothetical protein